MSFTPGYESINIEHPGLFTGQQQQPSFDKSVYEIITLKHISKLYRYVN